MMMRMLEAGGVEPFTDGLREADPDNPRGYYELERVKRLPEGDTGWLEEAAGRSVKVISELLRHLPEGIRYRVLFMERNLEEILASQRKMMERRGTTERGGDDDAVAEVYRSHLRRVRDGLDRREGTETLYLDYGDVLADPEAAARRVAGFLDRELDVEAMASVVDPSLYRQRA